LFAIRQGRNVYVWTFIAYFTGLFALIPLALLTKKPKKPLKELSPATMDKLEAYFAKRQFKDANNVDDLFKQLETK
jgi:hypothetical protein